MWSKDCHTAYGMESPSRPEPEAAPVRKSLVRSRYSTIISITS